MSARRRSAIRFLTVTRGGEYVRVADPAWSDPLSGAFARERGGRWNAPGGFAVVYLNRDVRVARANVLARFSGLPYGPEDLEPSAAPALVSTEVATDEYADLVSSAGCVAAALPASYPDDGSGGVVPHEVCRPIGRAAWDAGLPGIACRSAAVAAPQDGEELAWFARGRRLAVRSVRVFADWF